MELELRFEEPFAVNHFNDLLKSWSHVTGKEDQVYLIITDDNFSI
jgi:hypothetical protein